MSEDHQIHQDDDEMEISKRPFIDGSNNLNINLPQSSEALSAQQQEAGKRGLYNVIFLSIIFLIFFSAYNSTQNMVSEIFTENHYEYLGNVSVQVIYVFLGICSLFSSNLIKRISYKNALLFSSFGYMIYISLGYLVVECGQTSIKEDSICSMTSVYFIVNIGAALCGSSASMIWIAQGGYVDAISTQCPHMRGKFFGLFWAIVQASQVLGNVVALIFLNINQQWYFLCMAAMSIASGLSFMFLPNPQTTEQKQIQPKQKMSCKELFNVKAFTQLFKVRQLYPLLFFMAFAGVIIAFYAGFLHNLISQSLPQGTMDDDEYKKYLNMHTDYVFICLGCFEIISGLILGYVQDRVNLYLLATIGTVVTEVALVLSLLGYFLNNYTLCFFIGALFGFSDCWFNSLCSTICSKDYEGYLEIFAVFRLTLSFFVAITQDLIIVIKPYWVFILILIALQVLTNLATRMLATPDKSQLKKY